MSETSPIKKRVRPPKDNGAPLVNNATLIDRGESQMLVVIDHGTGSDGEQVCPIRQLLSFLMYQNK